MNGRRLLQEVVQKERRLRRELHDTVERKEFISYRMVKHQVSPLESTRNKHPLYQVTKPPPNLHNHYSQSDISSLETVRHHSASLLEDIKDTSLSARAASDQASVPPRATVCRLHPASQDNLTSSFFAHRVRTGSSARYRSWSCSGSNCESVAECRCNTVHGRCHGMFLSPTR